MENAQIGAVFDRIADILEILGENPFRIRSYRNAARNVADLTERLQDLAAREQDLTDLPGVGAGLAEKIHEILDTGTCQTLRDLQGKLPQGLPDLLNVPGLGPRKVKMLHEALGVADLKALKKAAEAGRIRDLEGMGAKTEQNILKGLKTLEAEAGRTRLKEAADRVADIGRHLADVKGIRRWEVAGSCRRRRETVGDLDILVQASDRAAAAEGVLAYQPIEDVLAKGKEKISVRLAGGMQVDFRFIEPAAFGAAEMYFTGSKAHNIRLRKRAQARNLKLNEYGLFRGTKRVAGATEKAVFAALGLPWIPPELREDRGEIDAAEKGELPDLLTRDDLRGDLHAHTTATDGANTPQELVRAARQRGYAYLAVTDHSKAVTVAGGLDDDALRRQADAVREVDAGEKRFWLLAGVEVDILKSGKLDISEKVLADLDWVVASVHSYFRLDEAKMTDRLLAAVGSGVVDCIGHPFGRADLDLIGFGVSVARRGWLEKGDVLNTRPLPALRKRLKRR